MILDQSRNKGQQDLQLSTNLTRVFVLYITPPKVQNEDPVKIRIRMLFVCTRMLLVWQFLSPTFFMAKIETEIINHCTKKALVWKRYIDDVFSLWDTSKEEVNIFIEQANSYHPTIKFTAEISGKEITFLDTRIYKGARFEKKSILDTRTHFKPTETFQYTQFKSCHPPGVKKGFIKGEALRLLRTNSSKETFEENINKHQQN